MHDSKNPPKFGGEHLFISYAWEDRALADWLTLKLTAEGYRVWCDRFKMLGGESFPKEIDNAIKVETFRVLALLSKNSISKPNPTKERTLALAISKQRNIDFLIPLNVDGLKPTELDWMLSDLSYIGFSNWSDGLSQLLKRLHSLQAPRPLLGNGLDLVAQFLMPKDLLLDEEDDLVTNCFTFEEIPDLVTFEFSRALNVAEHEMLRSIWPARWLNELFAVAFEPPPGFGSNEVKVAGNTNWKTTNNIEKFPTRDIVSELLSKAIECKFLSLGLVRSPLTKTIYFPLGCTEKNKIHYNKGGRKVSLKTSGRRRFGLTKFDYYLAPKFRVRQDMGGDFRALFKLRFFLTDEMGVPLKIESAIPRRKALAKSWFNHHWRSRQLAIATFMSQDSSHVALSGGAKPILMNVKPLSGRVGVKINDQLLARLPSVGIDAERDDIVEPT
jgi:hypothetical protein